jgi:hypothetical protein
MKKVTSRQREQLTNILNNHWYPIRDVTPTLIILCREHFSGYCEDHSIKKDKMGAACATYAADSKIYKLFENLMGGARFNGLSLEERIILKRILQQ